MIVCWVLFALCVSISVVGWLGFFHYEAEIESIDSGFATQEPIGETDYSDLLNEEQTPEEILNDGESSETAREALDRLRRENATRLERAKFVRHETNFLTTGVAVGVLAFSILLWNIIWHTGHWIWMGRIPKGIERR